MIWPSKKIIVLLFAVIIIAGGTFAVSKYKERPKPYENPTASLITETDKIATADTDRDNLMDWEEELWKTDKNNPDTDADGTEDGEEIHSGRNPLVKGPNDKLDEGTLASKINATSEQDLSETDKFSRELFVRFVASRESNPTPPTEAEYAIFVENALLKQNSQEKTRVYGAGDFKVVNTEDEVSIRAYGNELGKILTKKPKKPLEHEMIILGRAIENDNPAELVKLEDNVAEYRRIKADLLAEGVPKSALPWHIELTNATEAMIGSITSMQIAWSDPIKALPGIGKYTDNSTNFLLSIQGFKKYFELQTIIFEQNESGYVFFSGI